MLKNIVFDMGGVLIEYNADKFSRMACPKKAEHEALYCNMFTRPEWVMLDRGVLSPAEGWEIFKSLLPARLQPIAEHWMFHWYAHAGHFPGMDTLIQELKANGYGLYILSNAPSLYPDYHDYLTCIELFDGQLYSCDTGFVKPEPEIYQTFFTRFNLSPAECFFIDDSAPNVEGGMRAGMDGFVFHGDVGPLRAALRKAGASVSENVKPL